MQSSWHSQEATLQAPANGLKALPTAVVITALPATLSGSMSLSRLLQAAPPQLAGPTDSFDGKLLHPSARPNAPEGSTTVLAGHSRRTANFLTFPSSRQFRRKALDRFFGAEVERRITVREARETARRQRLVEQEIDEELSMHDHHHPQLHTATAKAVCVMKSDLDSSMRAARQVLVARVSETQACLLDVLAEPITNAASSSPAQGEAAAPSDAFSHHHRETLSVAEKLLYVILRTSAVSAIAEDVNDANGAEEEDVNSEERVSPGAAGRDSVRDAAWSVDLPSQLGGGTCPGILKDCNNTSSDSLTPQKERVEGQNASGFPVTYSKERPKASSLSQARRAAEQDRRRRPRVRALPIEARCWLSPSTIALIEQSAALRRTLRWSCNPDPVVSATLNRGARVVHGPPHAAELLAAEEGRHVSHGMVSGIGDIAGFMSVAGVGSDALLEALTTSSAAEAHMHDVCDALVAHSLLPLPSLRPCDSDVVSRGGRSSLRPLVSSSSVAGADSNSERCVARLASRVASLQPLGGWAATEEDAVQVLFQRFPADAQTTDVGAEDSVRHVEEEEEVERGRGKAQAAEVHPSATVTSAGGALAEQPKPLSVLFAPQYPADVPVCTKVYAALHRCVVGMPDPHCLVCVCAASTKPDGRRNRERGVPLIPEGEPEVYMSVSEDLLVCSSDDSLSEGSNEEENGAGIEGSHRESRDRGAAGARAAAHARKKRRMDGATAQVKGTCREEDAWEAKRACPSGLLSMLEWGCECGTLFLRLSRLCEVASQREFHVGLGSYGQAAIEALRMSLSLLRRLVVEMAVRPGGLHRVSFHELVDAQRRLTHIQARIRSLARVFGVSNSPRWRAADAVPSLSSATLLSTLYQHFTTRTLNALGEYSGFFAADGDGGEADGWEAWITGTGIAGSRGTASTSSDSSASSSSSSNHNNSSNSSSEDDLSETDATSKNRERNSRAPLAFREEDCEWAHDPAEEARHRRRRERHRNKLSCGFDPIAFVLVRTMRPLHTMLHAWLTRGECVDRFDEFFIVPTATSTSGYVLDCSPHRLPVFISVDAASDMLNAGISLRVLRAAATHVILSTRHELRVLDGRDADAEDVVAERDDALLMGSLVKGFLSSLVGQDPLFALTNPLPMVNPLSEEHEIHQHHRKSIWRGGKARGEPSQQQLESAAMVRGQVSYWREYYNACNAVLLAAVAQAVADSDGTAPLVPAENGKADEGNEEHVDQLPTASVVGGGTIAEGSGPSCAADCAKTSAQELDKTTERHTDPTPAATTQAAPEAGGDEGSLASTVASHITIAMMSDDDDSGPGGWTEHQHHRLAGANLKSGDTGRALVTPAGQPSLWSSPSSVGLDLNRRRSSVLGLHRVAERNAIRMGPGSSASAISSSSAASSRVTTALYGAITEELRQVVRVVQQQEEQTELARSQMRAEYEQSVLRQKWQARLVEWKGQRMALKTERTQAIRCIVDEVREVYEALEHQHQQRQQQQQQQQQATEEERRDTHVDAATLDGPREEEEQPLLNGQRRCLASAAAFDENPFLGKLVVPLPSSPQRRRRKRAAHHRSSSYNPPQPRVLLYRTAAAAEGDQDEEEEAESSGSGLGSDTSGPSHGTQDALAASNTFTSSLFGGQTQQHQRRRLGSQLPGGGGAGLAVAFNVDSEPSPLRTGRNRKRIVFSASGSATVGSLTSSPLSQPFLSPVTDGHGRLLYTPRLQLPEEGGQGRRKNTTGSLIASAAAAATASLLSLPQRSQQRYLLPSSKLILEETAPMDSAFGARASTRWGSVLSFAAAGSALAPRSSIAQSSGPRTRTSVFATPAFIHPIAPLKHSPSSSGVPAAKTWNVPAALKAGPEGDITEGRGGEGKALRPQCGSVKPGLGTASPSLTMPTVDTPPSHPTAAAVPRKLAVRVGEVTAEALAAIAAAQEQRLDANEEAQAVDGEGETHQAPRDEFGFAHPDEMYVIADINDDEFIARRVGPRRYDRSEIDALLAELAEQQARLRETSIEAPGYLAHCRDVARKRLHYPDAPVAVEEMADGCCEDHWVSDDLFANPPDVWRDERFEYDLGSGISCNNAIGTKLERFDGRLALAASPALTRKGKGRQRKEDARAYRRLRSALQSLHLDSSAQASALLWCPRYYHTLAHCASRYLTHKALQLTLLPPYGSLYRMLKQILDVLLLQNGLVAARLVEVWTDHIVGPTLADAGGSGLFLADGHPVSLHDMAAVPPGKRFSSAEAMRALNDAFQKEWSTCVLGGDATMAVEWQLLCHGGGGGQRLGESHQRRGSRTRRESAFDNMFNTTAMWLDNDDADARRAYMSKYADRDYRGDGGGAGSDQFDDWLTGPPSPLFLLAELRLAYDQPPVRGSTTTSAASRPPLGKPLVSTTSSSAGTFFWLLPNDVMHDYADLFTTLLFWKTAEQLTTHTWRESLRCGEPDAFFFSNSVRHLLLSLQQHAWFGVAALCANYRASLQFDSGVLFGYSCLDSFTEDHRRFVAECRFAALLTPGFARCRRLVYQALRLVEEMERVLLAANTEMVAAERRAMAAFHALVDSDSESTSDDDVGGGSSSKAAERPPPFTLQHSLDAALQAKSRDAVSEAAEVDEGDHGDEGAGGEGSLSTMGADADYDALYANCLKTTVLSSSDDSDDGNDSEGDGGGGGTEPGEDAAAKAGDPLSSSSVTASSAKAPATAAGQRRRKASKGTGRKGSAANAGQRTKKDEEKQKRRKKKKREARKRDKAIIATARTGRIPGARNAEGEAAARSSKRSSSAGVSRRGLHPPSSVSAASTSPAPTPSATPRPRRGRSSTPTATSSHPRSKSVGASASRGTPNRPATLSTSQGRRDNSEQAITNERLKRKEQRVAQAQVARQLKAAQVKERRRGILLSIAKRTIQEAHEDQRRLIRDEVRGRLRTLTHIMRRLLRELECVRDACAAGLEDDGGEGILKARARYGTARNAASREDTGQERKTRPKRDKERGRKTDKASPSSSSSSSDDDDGPLIPDEEMLAYQDPALAVTFAHRGDRHRPPRSEGGGGGEGGGAREAPPTQGVEMTAEAQYTASTAQRQQREWRAHRRRVLLKRLEQMNSLVQLLGESLRSLKRKT